MFLSTTVFAEVDEQRQKYLDVINDPEFQRLFKEVEKDMREVMWIIRENEIRRECFEQYYGEKNEK